MSKRDENRSQNAVTALYDGRPRGQCPFTPEKKILNLVKAVYVKTTKKDSTK